MTINAESLAEAIMKLAEDDGGLVTSKLVELINQHKHRITGYELLHKYPDYRETLMGLANKLDAERARIEAVRVKAAADAWLFKSMCESDDGWMD